MQLILLLQIVFVFTAYSQPYYRSRMSGNWNVPATWDSSNAAIGPWTSAITTTPGIAALAINIQAGHVVRITANVTADDINVNLNGTLRTTGASILTVNNGLAVVDLQINGTFEDSSSSNIAFSATAYWAMGANGTLVKYTSSACNNWQLAYSGGIANIPATSNWIHRRTNSLSPPSISTTAGVAGAWYPNLKIENYVSGTWDCDALSSTCFNGVAGFPTVKGTLDIGGSSPANCFVRFMNKQTNANPTKVQGLFWIRNGHTFSNHGTGVEVQGNVQIDGKVDYLAGQTPKFNFTGTNPQTVSGNGTLMIYDSQINKGGGSEVTLNTPVFISNSMTFTSGLINTSATNILQFDTAATVNSTSSVSFANGPVRKSGTGAFTFPTGKKIAVGAQTFKPFGVSSGGSGAAIWTENFNNGCVQNCVASSYSGPNGAWTMTDLGPSTQCGGPVEKNQWFVSCAENGNAVGSCGTGCGNDATLHVGSLPTSPSASVFCTTGDCGAAYDAGGYCGLLGFSPSTFTEKRMESPTINLTGKRGLQITFKYIEYGEGTNDNATLWYYDGATWSQLADMPKTLCGNSVCATGTCATGPALDPYNQGVWTQITYALPVSLNNNANAKIGFKWKNDDNGTGSDPSFAVDDVQILEPLTYTCEYFYANPQTVYNNILQSTLDHISACEYWYLNKNSGTGSKQVTLSWDSYSCGVTNTNDLRVARWDSTNYNPGEWRNHLKGTITGNNAAGTITSLLASGVGVNMFGPYTLASATTENPLPVELLSFNAIAGKAEVKLNWKTSSEPNNDFFEIEKTNDGKSFHKLIQVPALGNASTGYNYIEFDTNPFEGISYYRLKQTDLSGTFTYSNLVPVYFGNDIGTFTCFYSDQTLHYTFNEIINSRASVFIYNAIGELLFTADMPVAAQNQLPLGNFRPGLYLVSVRADGLVKSGRFMVK